MLMPAKVKHRKVFRGKRRGIATKGNKLEFGDFKKPVEVRMGKGKGDPEFWVDVIKRGRVLYELEGVSEPLAREAMKLAQRKLPFKTRFISRTMIGVGI